MIGGIFENISKTLGGGDKYFLELDDSAGTAVAPVKAPAPKVEKAAVSAVKEAPAKQAAAPAKQAKKAAAVEPKAPATASAAKTASAPQKAAPAPAKAVEAKKETAKPAANQKTAKKGVKSSESQVLTSTDLIVNAITAAGPIPMDTAVAPESSDAATGSKTFSTDHLLPLDNQARRQPGPGFGGFRTMAKSVTRRKSGL